MQEADPLDASPSRNEYSGIGRPPVGIWSQYTVVVPRWATSKKQHPDVQCKYCAKHIRNAMPKKHLRPHIRRCPRAPQDVRERYPPTPAKRSHDGGSDVHQAKRARVEGTPGPRRFTNSENRAFHHEIAAAFYASAIPFRVIENKQMRHVLTKYCPGMPLPTRQDLASALLDEAYREERASVEKALRKLKCVTVVCDGWSDPNSESVLNFMIVSPFMRPVFWCSIRSGADQHTGEYMASALAKVINEVEAIVGRGAVCAVVTDNAANMRKAWELLMAKIPSLTCNGCSAHTLNLLLKDMFGIEYMSTILSKALAVTKFVRKRPGLLHWFRAKQCQQFGSRNDRRALVIPVATRWYSSTNCISSVVKNEEVLRAVFRNTRLLERYGHAAVKLKRVQDILADSVFWTKARAVLRLVKPVIKALGALERDGCCLSMVYHYFRSLKHNVIYHTEADDIDKGVLLTIRGQIQSRWRMLKRESVLAAFLLDPSKRPDSFEDLDMSEAVEACAGLASRAGLTSGLSEQGFREEIIQFAREKESWGPDEREHNAKDTPLDWWFLHHKEFHILHPLATRVLSIPTSSAASERSWSVHAFIHNKRRNRLKPERVEKLAFVYSNAGAKAPTSSVHYVEVEQYASDCNISGDSSESDPEISPAPTSVREARGLIRGDVQTPTPNEYHLLQNTDTPSFQTPTSRPNRSSTSRRGGRRRRNTPPSSSRRLASPSPAPQAQRTLFGPVSDTPTSMVAANHRRRVEFEAPLTQSSSGGAVFTRADEYQVLFPREQESSADNPDHYRSEQHDRSQRTAIYQSMVFDARADLAALHEAAREPSTPDSG